MNREDRPENRRLAAGGGAPSKVAPVLSVKPSLQRELIIVIVGAKLPSSIVRMNIRDRSPSCGALQYTYSRLIWITSSVGTISVRCPCA